MIGKKKMSLFGLRKLYRTCSKNKRKDVNQKVESRLFSLPRHMRQAHDWQKEDVKKVERLFGLRKLYRTCSKNKRKDTESIRPRFPKACPVYECRSEVKKLCVLHIKKISLKVFTFHFRSGWESSRSPTI